MFHNLKILAEKHFVTLISFIEQEQELENIHEIEALGVQVKTVLRRPVPGTRSPVVQTQRALGICLNRLEDFGSRRFGQEPLRRCAS